MASSYIVRTPVAIQRQAGDTGSIVFIVPVALSLTGFTTALFQVRNFRDEVVFEKETPTDVTIVSQTITVNLASVDTTDIDTTNLYDWELQISSTTEVITVGKGTLEILKEIAR